MKKKYKLLYNALYTWMELFSLPHKFIFQISFAEKFWRGRLTRVGISNLMNFRFYERYQQRLVKGVREESSTFCVPDKNRRVSQLSGWPENWNSYRWTYNERVDRSMKPPLRTGNSIGKVANVKGEKSMHIVVRGLKVVRGFSSTIEDVFKVLVNKFE